MHSDYYLVKISNNCNFWGGYLLVFWKYSFERNVDFLDAHFMALFFLFVAHCHYGMEDSEVCKEDQLCLHAGGEKIKGKKKLSKTSTL